MPQAAPAANGVNQKKGRSFFVLFGSFLSVIFLCFLLVIILIVKSASRNLDAMEQSYAAAADAAMNSVASYISDFQDFSEALTEFREGTELTRVSQLTSSEISTYNLSTLAENMNDVYAVRNKIPGSILYLYFHNSDYAFRMRDAKNALADGEIFNILGITEQDWNTLIQAGETPTALIEQTDIMEFPRLLLAQNLMEDATLISAIPADTLTDQLKRHYLPEHSHVLVLTSNGQYLISDDTLPEDFHISSSDFLGFSADLEANVASKMQIGSQDYYVYPSELPNCEIQTVVLIPDTLSSAFRSYIMRTILFALILWVVIGGFLTWILAKKLYKPISLVLSSLPDLPDAPESDIAQLQYFVNTLVNRNESYQETLKKQQYLLSSSLFLRLLNQTARWTPDVERYLAEADFPQNTEKFLIFTLLPAKEDSPLSVTSVDQTMPYRICQRIKEELQAQHYDSFVISCMDTYVGFLDLTNQEALPDFSALTTMDIGIPGLHFSVAVSNSFSSLEELSHAYTQASVAADILLLSNKEHETVLFYRDIRPASQKKLSWNRFLGFLEQLSSQLGAMDYEAASDSLQRLFEKLLASDCSPEEAQLYMKYLLETVKISIGNTAELNSDKVQPLLDSSLPNYKESTSEIRTKLSLLLQKLPDYVESSQQDQGIIDQILEYVNQNYSDPMISAGVIADQFEVSLPWLSVHFKDQAETGFLDYLHTCRLNAAKKELAETDNSIQTIAINCGYTSAATFSRTFRKYEGVTPSWYRQNHQAE